MSSLDISSFLKKSRCLQIPYYMWLIIKKLDVDVHVLLGGAMLIIKIIYRFEKSSPMKMMPHWNKYFIAVTIQSDAIAE